MVYSKLRANLEIIAEALEGSPATDTAGYAVGSSARTVRRLWGDVSNLLVDMIDREKELQEAESTLEEWWARFIIVEKKGLRVLKQ